MPRVAGLLLLVIALSPLLLPTVKGEVEITMVKMQVPEVVIVLIEPEKFFIEVRESDFLQHKIVYSSTGILLIGSNYKGVLKVSVRAYGNSAIISHMYINVDGENSPINLWSDDLQVPGERRYKVKFGLLVDWELPRFNGEVVVVFITVPA